MIMKPCYSFVFGPESNQRHKDLQSKVPINIVVLRGFSDRLVPRILICFISKHFFVKKGG